VRERLGIPDRRYALALDTRITRLFGDF